MTMKKSIIIILILGIGLIIGCKKEKEASPGPKKSFESSKNDKVNSNYFNNS